MQLYAHPFSSYCQKALTALYETDTPFEYLHLETLGVMADLTALWPMKRFPILTDGATTVVEATSVIEYVDARHGQGRLIPTNPVAAVEVRMMDRVFDNYINTPQQKFVFDILRPEADRDPYGVEEARRMLDTAYAWLDQRLADTEWATGYGFTLADCAAAPALFYADWTHPISERFEALRAYRARLLARPSFARCVDEARRYRHYFPLGAPDRD